jgi:hypothetical protein
MEDGTKRTVGLESQTKYWATPICQDAKHSGHSPSGPGNAMKLAYEAASWNANSAATNSPSPAGATDAQTARAKDWPTPKGTDGTKGGPNQAGSKGDLMLPSAAAQWPTPNAMDSEQAGGAGCIAAGNRGHSLTSKVTEWPTPAARDYRSPNSEQHALVTGGGRKHMDQLSNFVAHSSHLAQPMPDGPPSCESGPDSPPPSTKRLNPAFGEWLMGWPVGWTIAEPSASSASETALWRFALQQQLCNLLDE